MNKHHEIPIPIYHSVLHLCIGEYNTYIDMCKEIGVQEHKIPKEEKSAFGFFGHYPDEDRFTMWLRELPTTIETYSNVVHEIEHFVFFFLSSRGLEHTKESDEAYAYLSEYVYGEIDTIVTDIRLTKQGSLT